MRKAAYTLIIVGNVVGIINAVLLLLTDSMLKRFVTVLLYIDGRQVNIIMVVVGIISILISVTSLFLLFRSYKNKSTNVNLILIFAIANSIINSLIILISVIGLVLLKRVSIKTSNNITND